MGFVRFDLFLFNITTEVVKVKAYPHLRLPLFVFSWSLNCLTSNVCGGFPHEGSAKFQLFVDCVNDLVAMLGIENCKMLLHDCIGPKLNLILGGNNLGDINTFYLRIYFIPRGRSLDEMSLRVPEARLKFAVTYAYRWSLHCSDTIGSAMLFGNMGITC